MSLSRSVSVALLALISSTVFIPTPARAGLLENASFSCADELGHPVLTLKKSNDLTDVATHSNHLTLASGLSVDVDSSVVATQMTDQGGWVDETKTTEYSNGLWVDQPGSVQLTMTEFVHYGSLKHPTRCSGGCGYNGIKSAVLQVQGQSAQNLKCKYIAI